MHLNRVISVVAAQTALGLYSDRMQSRS